MRIAELYNRREPVISFEFFPPKGAEGYRVLFQTIADLKRLNPGFVSVTWGAGGSTHRKTIELTAQIQREIGLLAMAHLTCTGVTAEELGATLDRLAGEGIQNVLALRGDPPKDQPDWRPAAGGFRYARELIALSRSRWDFCVGGACFPETHPDAESPESDLDHLLEKVQTGAEFLISQLFFDNTEFFRFVERARAKGISVPIVPGIMPVTSLANLRRIPELCNARIPQELASAIEAAGEENAERALDIGVRWATKQCRELLEHGVPGIHFYTLNRSPATRRVHRDLFAT